MEKPKQPNALAELMARDIVGEQLSAMKQKPQSNASNSADNIYSPATLRALERFGKNYDGPKFGRPSKPEPLPLPGTDWDLWADMPKALLPEVVAVSLGIDPSAIKPASGYADPGKEFARRLKLACAYVSEAGPLRPIKELGHLIVWGKPEEATVSLPEFAAWALSMGWELPEKFPRLKAAPRQPTTASTPPTNQNPLHVAIQQIVKSELQKHKPAPVMPIEPQATTPSPAPVVAVGASGSDEPWKKQARTRAYEIIKRDKEKDLYPSQVDIADEIAKQFRRDGLTGADGKPLTGAYIKRHALNGISSAQSKLVSTVMRQSK